MTKRQLLEKVRKALSGMDFFGDAPSQKVAVDVTIGRNVVDDTLELDCRIVVLTPDGPGPQASTWILGKAFWALWAAPPSIVWDQGAENALLQCTGRIDGVKVTVNLWGGFEECF